MIEAGDTIQVIDCCKCGNGNKILWTYYRVDEVTPKRNIECCGCGSKAFGSLVLVRGHGIPLRFVRKIPPLRELEEQKEVAYIKD